MKKFCSFKGQREVSILSKDEAEAASTNCRWGGRRIYLNSRDDYAFALKNNCEIYREEIIDHETIIIVKDFIIVPMSDLCAAALKHK